jgi:hypothetical protein
VDLASVNRETFAGREGSDFDLDLTAAGGVQEPSTLRLSLTAVEALEEPPWSVDRLPFSLMFSGPAAPIMPQGIYRLAHAELGSLELFLVPVQPDRDGARYEAVFT